MLLVLKLGARTRVGLVALTVSVAFVACQAPLAIPRLDANLSGWDQPYVGVEGIRVHAFRTGAVRSLEGAVFAGGSWTSVVDMGAWAFVIEHPTKGLIVFDTGMAARASKEPEHYVGWLGAKMRMLDAPGGASLIEQMRSAGLDPAAVTYVVLSHVHFDHTGGVQDFPSAKIVVSAAEKEWIMHGLGKTDFVDLEALDGLSSWQVVDYQAEKPVATLMAAHDLLGDGSILTVDLSGHTPGSTGMVIRAPGAPVLLTGDAAWTEKSWRWPARPIKAADDDRWWEQAWRIKRFAELEPLLVVVPGHDDTAVAAIALPAFVAHAAPGQTVRPDGVGS